MTTTKHIALLVGFTALGCFGVFVPQALSQQPKPAGPKIATPHISWDGKFGKSASTPNTLYCLMGSGFLRAPTSPNFKSLVSQWLSKHPQARVIRVNVFGPMMVNQPDSDQVYVWINDGPDSLNEYLVRQGGCPGGTMLVPDTSRYPVQAHQPSHSRMLVSPQEYTRFIRTIARAEADAQKAKRGIWKHGTDIE